MEKIWCDHLVYKFSNSAQKHRWVFTQPSMPYSECIADDFIICPVCRKERPAEPKRLEDFIEKAYLNRTCGDRGEFSAAAFAVIEWMEDLIENIGTRAEILARIKEEKETLK